MKYVTIPIDEEEELALEKLARSPLVPLTAQVVLSRLLNVAVMTPKDKSKELAVYVTQLRTVLVNLPSKTAVTCNGKPISWTVTSSELQIH